MEDVERLLDKYIFCLPFLARRLPLTFLEELAAQVPVAKSIMSTEEVVWILQHSRRGPVIDVYDITEKIGEYVYVLWVEAR